MKKNILFSTFFAFGFLILAFPLHAQAGGRLFLDPGQKNCSLNEQFTVTLKADPGGTGIKAIDAMLTYDTARLELVEVQELVFFTDASVGTSQGFAYNTDAAAGKLNIYSFATIGNFSVGQAGSVASIKFRAKAEGTANVNFLCQTGTGSTDSSMWNGDYNDIIDCGTVGNGVYVIGGGTNPTATPGVSNPTVTPTPGSSNPTATPGASNPTATPASNPTSVPATATPSRLPDTGLVEPLIFGALLGGALLGIGFLGLIF